jgi:hypothetical protein
MSLKSIARIREYTRGKGSGQSYWVLVACILLYLLISVSLFKVFPPPWPDEVIFALPARSLFETGELQTPVVVGLEHHTFWMPPAYFVVLGSFFRVFGFGFETMRAFSLLCGTAILVLSYVISKHMKLPVPFLFLTMTLIVVDPFFLRYSKIGRPDSFTLVWILFSLLAHIRWLKARTRTWNVASIVLAAIATASHPIGLVAPVGLFVHRLVLRVRREIDWFSVWAPVISALLVYFALLFYWSQDFNEFLVQMHSQFARKLGRGIPNSLVNWASSYRSLPALLVLLCSAVPYTIKITSRKGWSSPEGAVTIFGLLAVASVAVNFELYYPLYYVPFVAIGIAGVGRHILEVGSRITRKIVVALILLGVVNAALFDLCFSYLYLYKVNNETSISAIGFEVSRLIPPHSGVLLLGSPNLFWELTPVREDLRFFDRVAIDSSRYELLLQRVNVVVVMRAYRSSFDEYVEGQRKEFESALLQGGKMLRLVGVVGTDQPYAYRGSVFVVEPSSR